MGKSKRRRLGGPQARPRPSLLSARHVAQIAPARRPAGLDSAEPGGAVNPSTGQISRGAGNLRWDRIWDLRRAQIALENAERRRDRALHSAKRAGASWRDIGTELGVSAQAVQQRFGRPAADDSDQ